MPATILVEQAETAPKPTGGQRQPTLPGYQILGELGRGGMGVVYRARHTKLDRIVALKMVLAGAHAGQDQLARFYAEAKACAHLQHSNIVQVYEVGEHDGLPYFSLEYVDGGSLTQKTAGKPQPVQEAAGLVEKLARAMHYAHEHHIVHRDLKPANVLLTSDGEPKITDFGLAKRLEDESSSQTRSGSILGTPSYMAPEQAMGEIHQIGPLTDVYSIGAILYELLTGRPPFLAATPMDTVIQVTKDEPVAPTQFQPQIPRDLETICLKCLQKEQPKRYASADELAEDLRRFLAGEPIKARPVSAPERLWRWCRRNPRIASLSAAVLALLVTVAVGSLVAAVQINHQRNIADRNARAEADARKEADRNADVARQERKRAEENALIAAEQGRLAVGSLHKVVTSIQAKMRSQPAMRSMRQELLQEAFAGLERVVSTTAESSSEVSRTRASAYQSMGDISLELGRPEQALELYKKMHAILEELAASEPAATRTKRNLAISYRRLGEVSDRLGARSESLDYHRRALKLREEWLGNAPDDVDALRAVADSCGRVAWVLLLAGNPTEALTHSRRRMETWQSLVARIPNDARSKQQHANDTQELAGSLSELGEVFRQLGDQPAASKHYQEYLALAEQLAAEHSTNVIMKWNLAVAYVKLAEVNFMWGETDAARQFCVKSLEPLQNLLTADPANAPAKRHLSLAHYALGNVCRRLDDPKAAQEHYAECRRLRQELAELDPEDVRAQTDLMLALARCGQHAQAAAIARTLRDQFPRDARNLYNVACGYSLCADAAGSRETELRRQYLDLAFETLADAIARGYKSVAQLESDTDLEPVRREARYSTLLAELRGTNR